MTRKATTREYTALIGHFFEQRVEGLFLVAPYEIGDSLRDFRRYGVPVISVQYKDASASETPLVAQSDRRAIRAAMGRLVELGHQKMAYFLDFWAVNRSTTLRMRCENTGSSRRGIPTNSLLRMRYRRFAIELESP